MSVKSSFEITRKAIAMAGLFLCANIALAQSAADNIRPVGDVCMQGQACVGQAIAGSGSSSASVTEAPAAAVSAPEPAPAQAAPATEMAAASNNDFDAEAIYNRSCMACHATGAAGAPMLNDQEAWDERLEKGMDAVMNNVINGINAMPARGLCMDCSDEDLRALVDYMVSQ